MHKYCIDTIFTIAFQCGKKLIREGHYGANEIKDLLKRLNEGWSELVSKSADKGSKLQQAQQQQQFNRGMEDMKVRQLALFKAV